MQEIVRFGKCLSDPAVVRLVALMRCGELCLCEVAAAMGCSRSVARSRLDKLCLVGVATCNRRGRWSSYGIDPRAWSMVESVFGVFRAETEFDETLLRDRRALRTTVAQLETTWCHDWRGKDEYQALLEALAPKLEDEPSRLIQIPFHLLRSERTA